MTQSNLGFIPDPITVAFDKLLPSRKAPDGLMSSRKFKQIISSIDAVGLIEPLTIAKADRTSGMHLLLDGHIRMFALQELGFTDAPCLIAKDDESYTYNNRINRLSTIQEHFMIRRAVDRGVTPARLAKSLELDLEHITKKINLLDGICTEAVRLLRDKHFSANLSPVLRKLKPTRQVECVELMVATNNITVSYAQALLAATPPKHAGQRGRPKESQRCHRRSNGEDGARNGKPGKSVQAGRAVVWAGRPQPGACQGLLDETAGQRSRDPVSIPEQPRHPA